MHVYTVWLKGETTAGLKKKRNRDRSLPFSRLAGRALFQPWNHHQGQGEACGYVGMFSSTPENVFVCLRKRLWTDGYIQTAVVEDRAGPLADSFFHASKAHHEAQSDRAVDRCPPKQIVAQEYEITNESSNSSSRQFEAQIPADVLARYDIVGERFPVAITTFETGFLSFVSSSLRLISNRPLFSASRCCRFDSCIKIN